MKPLLLILLTSLVFACKMECNLCFTPPDNFAFKIVDKSTEENLLNLDLYKQDTIDLYYFENSERKDVNIEIVRNHYNELILQSNQLGWIASTGASEFYLYLNYSDTDTINLDVRELSDRCCTWFETHFFSINNQFPEYDWDEYVYLIKK